MFQLALYFIQHVNLNLSPFARKRSVDFFMPLTPFNLTTQDLVLHCLHYVYERFTSVKIQQIIIPCNKLLHFL